MASKHLSEDEIRYVVDVESAKAQQEIRKLEKSSSELRAENKRRLDQLIKLEAAHKKNSQQYKDLKKRYNEVEHEIKKNTEQITKLTNGINVNALTMNQLKKQAKQLQRQLDDTAKSLNPEAYKILEDRLRNVTARMADLKQQSSVLKKEFLDDNTKGYLKGTAIIDFFSKAKEKARDFFNTSTELAESAEGIRIAFERLNRADLLDKLRTATHHTVDDLQLMQQAVKFKDFNLPVEKLGTMLAFAQQKAKDSGESIDYLVTSIVNGLGRQSKPILDNLGISAVEINEELKKSPDFVTAVTNIVERNMKNAGSYVETASERIAQVQTELKNKQLELGEALLPLKEQYTDTFAKAKIGAMDAILWLTKNKQVTLLLTVAVTGFTVAMTLANAQFRTWIAQTKLGTVATTAYNTVVSTAKGLQLLFQAAVSRTAAVVNSLRGNTIQAARSMVTARTAMAALNTTMKANVFIAIASAIIGAVVALNSWIKSTKEARKQADELNDSTKELKQLHVDTNAQLKKDIATLREFKGSKEEEIALVKEMNSKYGEAMGYYKSVKDWYDALIRNSELYCQQMIIEARVRNLANKAAEQDQIAYDLMHDENGKLRNFKKEYTRPVANYSIVNTPYGGSGIVETGREVKFDDKAYRNEVLNPWLDATKQSRILSDQMNELLKKSADLQKRMHTGSSTDPYASSDAKDDKKPKKAKHSTASKDPDDAARSKFNEQRKEDLEAAKQSYQEDLRAWEAALAQRKVTQEQYQAATSQLAISHAENLLRIEKSYQERAQGIVMKDGKKREELQKSQDGNVLAAERSVIEARIAQTKMLYDSVSKIGEMAKPPRTLEEERQLALAALESYYQTSLKLAEGNAEQEQAVTEAYKAAELRITEDYNKKILESDQKLEQDKLQLRQQYGLVKQNEIYAAEFASLEKDYRDGKLTYEQYLEACTNLEKKHEQQHFQLRQQYGLTSMQEQYEMELEQLRQHLENMEMTEEEYEEAKKQMRMNHWKEQFDYYSSLFGDAVKALQDAEVANIDAKYDAEIEAARQAGKDTTDIENKKANEKLKIQKKYADVNFAIQAAQIIANTATAIAKTFSELGFPAGIPAAILMSITGTAQLAAAIAERNKVKRMTLSGSSGSSSAQGARVATGREEGGFIDIERDQDGKRFHAKYDPNRRGYINRPTVIVGEGPRSKEWVASNAAIENPTIAPLIDIIDHAQRAGTVRTLDMSKWLINKSLGFSDGGYIRQATSPAQPMQTATPQSIAIFKKLSDTLDRIQTEGIPAAVALTEIDRARELQEQARRFGSK